MSNTTEGTNVYIVPTLTTIDAVKATIGVAVLDANNVKILNKAILVKAVGIDIIIPLYEYADNQRTLEEALVVGGGNALQTLILAELSHSAVVGVAGIFSATPPGWVVAAASGGILITVGLVSAVTDVSLGNILWNLSNTEYSIPKYLDHMATMPQRYGTVSSVKIMQSDLANVEIDFLSGKATVHDYTMSGMLKETREQEYIRSIYKMEEIKELTLNSTTYDITKENNLTVRNAIDDIPKVSFLLSHILIKTGESLDVGEAGEYKVQPNDTMSQIAERYDITTQQLLKQNTWLIDEGRVTFDQDKILIEINNIHTEIQDNIQQNTEDMNSLELIKHWFQTDLNIDEKEFAEIINAIKNDESTPSSEAIRKNIEETTREWEKAQNSKDDDNVHRQ